MENNMSSIKFRFAQRNTNNLQAHIGSNVPIKEGHIFESCDRRKIKDEKTLPFYGLIIANL